MYFCGDCEHFVRELVECSNGEPVETFDRTVVMADPTWSYRGCPYCGSENVRDFVWEEA